ncbi:serine/threonine-protein kinase 11-interacting protein-like isoform X2 [Littorina saxatilis]|uniref:serine/threonine-protein kinase 11-interacting protein-like isoform X2 n=1 Tax=Littorina saxatilis TaxID=31220 RepID=UPI0038B4E772
MDAESSWGLNSLQRLKALCHMLRDNADNILSGTMGITITSRTLYELNEAVDNLQDGLSPPHLAAEVRGQGGGRGSELEEWNYHLQLVLDIVSMAPVLVLYKGKDNGIGPKVQSNSAPAVQPVRLGYFTSLSHLEISYLPIQTIQDLLKMRERLETLVVVNCFSNNFRLQDVLEMCDQEVSVPMQWSTLKTLCLRCNNLVELDGSLRLCPRLEMLDLSRNRLVTTEAYLGYLMELRYVDLSYNDLTLMPAFSATAKKKLRVLLLAGNRLINLSGVEEMTSLEELDVSENLISSHKSLLPVRALHRLDKLNMGDCPASTRKDHRLLALQHISTVSLSRKFSLDGEKVTHKEIQNSRAILNNLEHHVSRRHHHIHIPSTLRRVVDYTDGSSHMGRGQEGDGATSEDLAINIVSVQKKKGRKKGKARMMDIPDMNTSTGGELSSKEVTPSTTPKTPSRMEALAQMRRLEIQSKRAEMEHFRRCYGDNWLQAVEDQAVMPRPASMANTMNLATEEASEKIDSLKKSASAVEKFGFSGRQDVTTSVDVHVSGRSVEADGVRQSESPSRVGATGKENSCASKAFDKESMFLSSGSGAEDGGVNDVSSRDSSRIERNGDLDVSRRTEVTLLSDDGETTVTREGGSREREVSSAMTDSVHDSLVEPEDQSEPFIVTLPDTGDHLLVTVSPRYLLEKNINGIIQDKLDLQSLEAVRVEVEEAKDMSGVKDTDEVDNLDIKEVRINLDFSYVRKDRRCRVYVMEDFFTAQHFSDLVQPFLDAKVEAAMKKLQVQHQCLKCNNEFTRGEAHTTVQIDTIPHKGSSNLRERLVLLCPKCKSDHVVQLEAATEPTNTITPSSPPSEDMRPNSLSRGQSFDQMMASQPPKAHSTPLKLQSNSCDMQTASSPHRKGSKPSSFRSLFASDDQDLKQKGDGPNPNSVSAAKLSETALAKQDLTVTQEEDLQLHDAEEDGSQVFSTATASDGETATTPTPAADLGQDTETPVAEGEDSPTVESGGYEFGRLDHRLALYLMMTVFENDEEFQFKVKSCVCQYMMPDEYQALVVITTLKLYILRVNTEDISVELSEALTLMEAQPHAELMRVDVGLGNQTLRLEYSSDCSSYTLVLRDAEKLEAVKELFSDHLQSYAMETGVPTSAVFNEDADQQTLDNLSSNVLTRDGQAAFLRLYILGFIVRGHSTRHPMAFVVSTSEICLVKTNHQWPSPTLQAPVTVDTVGKQFTVLERQKINNIATVEVHDDDHRKLRITFFNETSGDETQWLVTMEAEKGVISLIEAVRGPWEEAFDVEMDVEFTSFEMSL